MNWKAITHENDGSYTALICPDCISVFSTPDGLAPIEDIMGISDKKCASCGKHVAEWLQENAVKQMENK